VEDSCFFLSKHQRGVGTGWLDGYMTIMSYYDNVQSALLETLTLPQVQTRIMMKVEEGLGCIFGAQPGQTLVGQVKHQRLGLRSGRDRT
jgi:hypothetical protein